MTHSKDLNLALDLGHPHGCINIPAPDELDGNLLTPLRMQPQLDLSEFTLAKSL